MGRCEDAFPLLREAVKELGDDAGPHNDLGACLLQTGKYEDALAEFDKAAGINPDLTEALFNRGMCYQKMLLVGLARSELSTLLNEERDQEWKEEIKRRIDQLEMTEVRQPSEILSELRTAQSRGDGNQVAATLNRNFNSLIGLSLSGLVKSYLESHASGNAEAARDSLAQMRDAGKAFINEKQDRIVADAADYLEKLTKEDAASLLAPYNDYNTARGLLLSHNPFGATALLEHVRQSFHERGARVWELLASVNLATAHYESGRCADSIKVLEAILPQLQGLSWPFLLSRLYYQFGIDYSILGQDSVGIEYFNRALDLCHQSGEPDAKELQGISVAYWHLGDLDRALGALRASTAYSRLVELSAVDLANNYLNMADIYRQRDTHNLAQSYAEEALNFALHSRVDYLIAQSSSFLASEKAVLGATQDADKNLSLSFQALNRTSGGPRLHTEPLVLSRAGDIFRQKGELRSAIEFYSNAQAAASKAEGDANLLLDPLRGRARAYLASGDLHRARADLLYAVRAIEKRRGTIAGGTDRVHYLDSTQDVFDQVIALDLNSAVDDMDEAFGMAERARARALLDEIRLSDMVEVRQNRPEAVPPTTTKEAQARPSSLQEVQASLPPDMALLEYSVGSTGTYIFVIDKGAINVARTDADANRIAGLVNEYVSLLKANASMEELRPIGRLLDEYLVTPAEHFIASCKYLCIVPDKTLHFLPFAPLVDAEGKLLIERHAVTYAPSASVLVQCLREQSKQLSLTAESIVAVGDPDFDRAEFPQLRPLESAEREARTIARFYDSSKSAAVLGPDATEATLRPLLANCDVAHLAVHCLVNQESPWLAGLVLAADKDGAVNGAHRLPEAGLLRLSDIYRLALPHTKLVVLSACESALGQYYRGEGIVSLVHPFIAVHVPTVIATLWSVESAPTADLMIEFHRLRKANLESTAEALRDAQLQMARAGHYTNPYYWAPFIVVGSYK
jgi:CHAT domain-containing protein/tetratricopeptide (TPR) repeat protein